MDELTDFERQKVRPSFLTVLCILTFIGSAGFIISSVQEADEWFEKQINSWYT